MIIINIHIRGCNITCHNKTFQFIFSGYNRKCCNIQLLHQLPCMFHGNTVIHALGLSDFDILHLCSCICHKLRCLYPKIIKCILCFTTYCAGTFCHIFSGFFTIFQFCICKGRTNRIRVRIFMSHYPYFCLFTHFTYLLLIYYFM